MKYYVTSRNKTIIARDHKALVTTLRKKYFDNWETNHEYMRAYAERKLLYYKMEINYSCEEEFVRDLIKYGLIKIKRGRTFLQSMLLTKRGKHE